MSNWTIESFTPPPNMLPEALAGKPQKITVDRVTGRVFGYVARNGQRIEDLPFEFRVPREPNFDEFANPARVMLDDGNTVAVAVLPWKDGHPSAYLSAEAAVAHYNDPARAAATVRYGQDAFGIWAAGVVVPGANNDLLRRIEVHSTSGDWRQRLGRWRFLGACLVNVPALPLEAGMAVAASLSTDGQILCVPTALGGSCETVEGMRARYNDSVRSVAATLYGNA